MSYRWSLSLLPSVGGRSDERRKKSFKLSKRGAKILPTMRHRARPHRPEHHWLDRQAEEDFEFKDGDAGGMYMQDEVPTVRQIRLGRKGGSERVRKARKKSLWGVGYGGLYFFSSAVRAICWGMPITYGR